MEDLVLVERDGSVAVVTLNRPDKLNALSSALMTALAKVFMELQHEPSIAVVILTGAGRAFCAGLDLEDLASAGMAGFTQEGEYDVQAAILGFDRPIIGAINGVAATGGLEVALWCDVLIASQEARFVDTHARVGLIPGWGLSQRLSRRIGINQARELSFTGNFLSASKAENWGLVNRVVEPEALLSTCKALAEDMASCDRQTLVRYKRIINEGAKMDLNSALEYEQLGTELHAASQAELAVMKNKDGIMSRSRSKSSA